MPKVARPQPVQSFFKYLAATLMVLVVVPFLAVCELACLRPKAREKASSF